MLAVVLSLLVAPAAGFSLAGAAPRHAGTRCLAAAPLSVPRVEPRVEMVAPSPLAVIKWAAALPTMYALMSVNEYFTHRYFQHLEWNRPETFPRLKKFLQLLTRAKSEPKMPDNGHVEHHAETYDDMSLKNDARWNRSPAAQFLDTDPFRGTAFTWATSGLMTIQMLPTVLPVYALMGWSLRATFAILMPCMLIHALVWNAIHPPMHGLPSVPAKVGAPSWPFANALLTSKYGKWIYENHMGHHVLSGQCNYNVCCPLTDHLLGTYVPPKVWEPKMRAIPQQAVIRGAVVGPAGVPEPPTWEQQKAAREAKGSVAPTGPAEMLSGGGTRIADAYSS